MSAGSVSAKVDRGTVNVNQDVVLVNHHDPSKKQKVKISKLYEFDGLNKVDVQSATDRFYRSDFRYRRSAYRRYDLCGGLPGADSVPEDLRADDFHEFHRQ